jgi:uncharacterized delta-60 repeat protein
MQADGKIVVAGVTTSGGSSDNFAVARYNPDGSPDDSFGGGDGEVPTDFAGGVDEAFGVAIQPDGKIVVAGLAQEAGSTDIALARYTTDGILDSSFDADGKVNIDFAAGTDFGFALALQSDGKILVAGSANVEGSDDFALVRVNSDGSPDGTFGSSGRVHTDFGGNDDEARGIALQADGKIVVVGKTDNGSSIKFAVARYKPDGSPDFDFDADGKLTTIFGGLEDAANGVAIQAEGRIVAAGYALFADSSSAFAVARYNTDGSPDSNFDADGKATTSFGSGSFTIAGGVVIQTAGSRIVVAGTAGTSGSQFALARYNSDGSPDASFGTNGTVLTDFGPGAEVANSIALQPDGKIVAAGRTRGSGGVEDFALARYDGVAPEIAISVGGANVLSGSSVAFGNTPAGTAVTKTFTIKNLGNLSLTVSSIAVPVGYQLTSAPSFPFKVASGSQTSISIRLTAGSAGVFNGKVSIACNDGNENPFLFGVSGMALAPTQEIQVLTGATDIPDNTGAVNFGTVVKGSAIVNRSFTIRNIGSTNLTIGLPSGLSPFAVGSRIDPIVLPGGSMTFTMGLNTGTLGTFTRQFSITTNDSDENPFNFTLTGTVGDTSAAPMIRGESLTRQVDEGGVATLRGHLVDPDPNDDLFLNIDWGDGSEPETHNVGHAPFAFDHRYVDDPGATANDDYQVLFTWFDSGGGSKSKTLPVTVHNVAPKISVGLPAHLQAGEMLTRVGSLTDAGLDSWYATVDFDDGRGPQWLALGSDNSFNLNNVFTRPGLYKVQVRVFDDDGGIGTSTLSVNVRKAGQSAGPQPLTIQLGQKVILADGYRVAVTVLDDVPADEEPYYWMYH